MVELRNCPACGATISDEARINKKCEYCDSILDIQDDILHQKIYTLTIIRKNQFALINPSAKLYLDGQYVCNIDNDSTATIKVAEGIHTLKGTYSLRTATLNFDMNTDKTIVLWWDRITGQFKAKCE